ncbi:DUF4175 family protein, partial [Myxococcota bacterium]|nr:DUF4175 family protein [Myxococcota bacterium]
ARRRALASAALMTLTRATTLLGGLGLLGLWLSPTLSPAVNRAALWGLGLTALGVLGVDLLRPIWLSRDPRRLAARLERRAPQLRDGLLTCVELHTRPAPLLDLLSAQMSRALSALDWRAALPLSPPWAWRVAALMALLALTLTWRLAPQRLAVGLARIQADEALAVGPLVGDLTLRVTAPPHFNRPPRVLKNLSGPLRLPKGSMVEVEATTLEPAHALTLRLGEAATPMTLREGRVGQARFEVKAALSWRFEVETMAGARLAEAEPRALLIEPDQPPRVRLLNPDQDLELDDPRLLQVAFDVSDDLGLSRVAVELALAADPEHPELIDLDLRGGATLRGEDSVDLRVIEARGGDRLALTLRAWDNNGVDGPQMGASITRYITLRSPKARHYALTDQLRALLEGLLNALATRLELDWADGLPLGPRLKVAYTLTEAAATGLGEITAQMSDDPLTAEEIRLALAEQLKALRGAMAAEAQRAEVLGAELAAPSPPVAARAALEVEGQAVIAALEGAVVLVEAMTARLALEDMAALADEIRAAKAHLRELIEAYRQRPDEHLKKRIMRDIQRLQRQIDEIRARMAQLRQKLPEEFLNIEGMKKGELSKGLEDTKAQLNQLEEMLAQGKIDEALAALEQMDKALDDLSNALNEDMQALHDQTHPERQKALSELMDQARDLIKRQAEISAETGEAEQAAQAALKRALEQALKDELEALLKQVGRLRLTIEALPMGDLARPFYAEDAPEHLQRAVDDLYALVESRRLFEALDAAELAQRQLADLRQAARFDKHEREAEGVEAILRRADTLNDEIIEALTRLLESAQRQQQQQQGGARRQRQGLARRQREAAEQAQRMAEGMGRAAAELPALGEAPSDKLNQAREAMQRAARRLSQGRPGQARPDQAEAEQALKGLMEGLKQAGQPQRGRRDGGQQQRQQGGRLNQDKVRVPGADAHQAPEAFRRALLEAMKARAPEDFQESVKRYYDALIK